MATQTLREVQSQLLELERGAGISKDACTRVQNLLVRAKDEIDASKIVAEEQETPLQRAAMLEEAQALEQKLKESKLGFAKLKLSHSKQSVERFSSKRVELLSSANRANESERTEAMQDLQSEAKLINQSKSVTQTMTRVAALMKGEIERVEATQKVLEEENERMKEITEKMKEMGGSVNVASNAIKLLDQQERRDRMKVYAALAFFGCVVVYIVLKRMGVLRFAAFIAPMFTPSTNLESENADMNDPGHTEL